MEMGSVATDSQFGKASGVILKPKDCQNGSTNEGIFDIQLNSLAGKSKLDRRERVSLSPYLSSLTIL